MSTKPRIEEFSQAAAAGNAAAQFNMGLWCLRQEGSGPFPAPACEWFSKSARQGFAPAQTMMGRVNLGFPGGRRDVDAARSWFLKAADQGFAEGLYQLAELSVATGDTAGHYEEARGWLEKAGAASHPLALCQLAYLHDEGIGGAADPGKAIALYQEAARQGMPRAWNQLASCFATGHGFEKDAVKALAAYGRAAERLYPGAAQAQARLEAGLTNAGRASAAALSEESLTSERPAADRFLKRPACTPEVLSESPRIALLRNLFTRTECQHLIATARPHLEPSRVVSEAGQNVLDHKRSSWEMRFYPESKDMLVWIYERRLARLSETRVEQGEPLMILRYEPGQEYQPHVDFFDQDLPAHRKRIEEGGQRVLTMLTYLCDVEAGGGTEFPELDLTVQPEPGTTLAFYNVLPDGRVDPRTLHAGLPVETGVKWLATRWIRDRDWVERR